MFRAEQRTDGDRQRRRVRQLHALPIQQTVRHSGTDCRRTRETRRNPPSSPEMQEKLQEKEFPCVLHTIIPTETSGTVSASCKIGVKMQEGSTRDTTPTAGDYHPAGVRGGEVYNSDGQKESAALCNSPPRIHVPFHVSHMAISAQNDDAASYQQVGGEGGWF